MADVLHTKMLPDDPGGDMVNLEARFPGTSSSSRASSTDANLKEFDKDDDNPNSLSTGEYEEDVFYPGSPTSSSSLFDAPLPGEEGAKLSFSPLRIRESNAEDPTCGLPTAWNDALFGCAGENYPGKPGGHPIGSGQLGTSFAPEGLSFLKEASSTSPRFPFEPISPFPLDLPPISRFLGSPLGQYATLLRDIYRQRSHSDSDLHSWVSSSFLPVTPAKRSTAQRKSAPKPSPAEKEEEDEGEGPFAGQEFPLDLSLKPDAREDSELDVRKALGPTFRASGPLHAVPLFSELLPNPPFSNHHHHLEDTRRKRGFGPGPRQDTRQQQQQQRPALPAGEAGEGGFFACPICGQSFGLHDRLSKHVASRHRSRHLEAVRSFSCDSCDRSFTRSDMLTRHMRLHTGVKPYTCRVCNQVFSRSDHLSTHQRTHTGEKPYKCPRCPYAACRRDMITRHMRTHVRCDPHGGSDQPARASPEGVRERTPGGGGAASSTPRDALPYDGGGTRSSRGASDPPVVSRDAENG